MMNKDAYATHGAPPEFKEPAGSQRYKELEST